MKVVLTNNQLYVLKEALTARFTVSEARVTFLGLNEGFMPNVPPHQKLAMNLGSAVYHLKARDYFWFHSANPFERADNSYYFDTIFNVDGRKVKGTIRVSDHPVNPINFARRGVQYGISLVFSNGAQRIARNTAVEATIYEYVEDNLDPSIYSRLRDITSEFIKSCGEVTIEHGKVIEPSGAGLKFEKVTDSSGKKAAMDINLFTTSDLNDDTAKFMGSGGIKVIAVRDNHGNYTLSQEDLRKFNYGDRIHFYKLEDGVPVKLGRSQTVDA